MKKVKLVLGLLIALVLISGGGYFLALHFDLIAPTAYSNEDFGINGYVSMIDQDGDGIDDQSDIYQGVLAYIATNPQYQSKYYQTGYPDDNYGVCTDVVAQGLLNAGYDLKELVNQDIQAHQEDYDVDSIDSNIDFRRVRNLAVYFQHTAISLTTDIGEISQWQAGDIVVYNSHVAIVSANRNRDGVPFIIHHASRFQIRYEEDKLDGFGGIVGHYRIS